MIEHRLIEKLFAVIKKKLNDLSKDNLTHYSLIVVDFIRVYETGPIMEKKRIFFLKNWKEKCCERRYRFNR